MRSMPRSGSRARPTPTWRASSLSKRTEILFRIRNLVDRAPQGHRRLPDRGARQGADRCAGRGGPRPREPGVRVRHPAPAQGHLQRAGLGRDRRLPDPPAAGRGGRYHALQLPGHGADVDVRQRHRLRQHLHPEAVREGPVRIGLPGRAAAGGRPAGRRLQRRARGQGRGRRASWSTRISPPSASSARRPSRATSTRRAPGTASACRHSAAPRTTWWSCPMRTSGWPPTPPCLRPTDRPGSAAWRSAWWWRSAMPAIRWSTPSRSGCPGSRSGPGSDPESEMGPLITREHRDKVASYLDSGARPGRHAARRRA